MDKERFKNIVSNIGSEDWLLLLDAVKDQKFQGILTNSEKQILQQIGNDPNILRGYQEQSANIVAKYISWKVYSESNLKSLTKKFLNLEEQIDVSKKELQTISDTAKYIGGATVLVEYSNSFATAAKNHSDAAKNELHRYFGSLVGFASIVGLVFFVSISDFSATRNLVADDIQQLPLNTGVLALKAFLLVFAYQITQFFRKNYGAEKHLQEVYQHRSDVLQSLHAVYNSLSDQKEKDEILRAGALFAYERGETGYITTKEGAGGGDTFFESIFGRIFKS